MREAYSRQVLVCFNVFSKAGSISSCACGESLVGRQNRYGGCFLGC